MISLPLRITVHALQILRCENVLLDHPLTGTDQNVWAPLVETGTKASISTALRAVQPPTTRTSPSASAATWRAGSMLVRNPESSRDAQTWVNACAEKPRAATCGGKPLLV